MAKVLPVSTTAVAANKTPFCKGLSVAVFNGTAGAIDLTGSDTSGGTYTPIVSVPANGFAEATLTAYLKAASGTLYLVD